MKCFLDMDGVLCDFVRAAMEFHRPEKPYVYGEWTTWDPPLDISLEDFWRPFGEEFWASLPWTSEGRHILSLIELRFSDIYLLTSPCPIKGCREGKIRWIDRHISRYRDRCIFEKCKGVYAANDSLLVDDADINVEIWRRAGGTAILVPRPWNTNRNIVDIITYIEEQLCITD